ncbi:tetratricopeptide repeat protein [Streptomyces sp. NPDC048172]|uniref:tetratricopeptide repeat protein n=1 Tax=Streptomyces sp. NPDC048172 TaxID=3365505 RepID=UPI0037203B78
MNTVRPTGITHANVVEDASISGPVIQAGEISGGVHVHAAPSERRAELPVPQQLLPVPGHFINRECDVAKLEEMRSRHRGAPQLIAVTGPAGVGKTTLVSRWLGSLRDPFPDGRLYADMGGYSMGSARGPGEILGQFIRAFGYDQVPVELAEQAALWRSLTVGRRLAVVLDNAVSAAQVRPLIPGEADSLVAVVSRQRLSGLAVDGAAFHHLGVLSAQAAVELLSNRAGGGRTEEEPGAVRQVVALCAGLPLAVCVVAARMAARPQQTFADLAGAMRRPPDRLEELYLEGDQAVGSALDESYRSLAPDRARGYRRLGLLPVDVFSAFEAAAGCALGLRDARGLLDGLLEANLLEEAGPHPVTGHARFRFHDLTRLHAMDRAAQDEADPTAARAETERRVLDWYLATATPVRTLLVPGYRPLGRDYAYPPRHALEFPDGETALRWMNEEAVRLMRAVRTAADRGWHSTCWQLADAMQPFFLRSRPYDLWTEAHRLGLAAAEHAGQAAGVSQMLTSGGAALRNAGQLDEAEIWFTRALQDARDRQDRRAEAQALHGLGQTHRLAGRLEQAAPLFQAALAEREEIGYRRGAALSRLCLGDVALAMDRADEARSFLEQARSELLGLQDAYDAARALAFLGRAHAHRTVRNHPEAERLLLTALDEFRSAGSVPWQARVLEMLGQTAEDRNDAEAARRHYDDALALYGPRSPRDVERVERLLAGLTPGPDDER